MRVTVAQPYNAAGFVRLMFLPSCPADVIDTFQQDGVNVLIVLRSRLSADVGGSRYQSFLELIA